MNKRILIVGISCSGKTRYARKMASQEKIPVYHLDSLFWKENWVEQDPAVVDQQIRDLLSKESWIVEGYIEPLAKERMKRATEIIFLDVSRYRALTNYFKRIFSHQTRPELPATNQDKFSFGFLWMLVRRSERKEIIKCLRHQNHIQRITHPAL